MDSDFLETISRTLQLKIEDSNVSSSRRPVDVFPHKQGQDVLRLKPWTIDEWLAGQAFSSPDFFIGTIPTRLSRFQYPHRGPGRGSFRQDEEKVIVPSDSQTTTPWAIDRPDGARGPNA